MLLFDDTYRTIDVVGEGIFRDKGSKFLAYAYPFEDERDLKAYLQRIKIQHPKANHHCWAYRLSQDRSVYRVNDDGEPAGTAGRPILNVLLAQDITNVLLVVVRYFGGTLLGVPGLINAYKEASKDALSGMLIQEKTVNDYYDVHFDYEQMNAIMRVIKEEQLTLVEQHFDQNCRIQLSIRKTRVNAVLHRLQSLEIPKLHYIKTV